MGGHHALDPLVCLTYVAAATTSLRLYFNAFVVTYRNPFLAGKNLGDLDWTSGGRVIAGLVPGYLTGVFAALGVPLEERAERFDEALDAMTTAWTREPVEAAVARRVPRFHQAFRS